MKTAMRVLLPALALLAQGSAWAEDNWYVGIGYHATELKDAESRLNLDTPVACFALPGGEQQCNVPVGDDSNTLLILFPGPGGLESKPFDISYDNGDGFNLTTGFNFRGMLRAELEYRQADSDVDKIDSQDAGDQALESKALMVNMWFDFNESGTVQPYVGLGVGASELEFDGSDDTVLTGQVGVGVNFAFNEHWMLDAGYRYFTADDPDYDQTNGSLSSDYEGHGLLLGLRYNFDPIKRPAGDADGDGVPDDRDRCPGTPRGAPVNADGCADSDGDGVVDIRDLCPNTPPGTPVDESGCPDTDGDGVPDKRDLCPNTPPGTPVDAAGCPDSDGDGVADNVDACPGTPAGQPVMSNGCGVNQSAILQGVNFEFNLYRLTPSAEVILERVADALKDSPGFVVQVQGHTDSAGTEDYNYRLSTARAKAVRDFLIKKGVESDRVTARGFGESQPIADNRTAEGRASNRRVELRVLEQRQE